MNLTGAFDLAPILTISNTGLLQFTTQNIIRNTTNNPISQFTGVVTNVTATLNNVIFVTPNNGTTNNYIGGIDINNFKLWYNTINTFSGATQLGTSQSVLVLLVIRPKTDVVPAVLVPS